jgi:ABC-type tungstate transport system permease subunit
VFGEEIVLVGPEGPGDFANEDAKGVMGRVFREGMPFFSLISNEWSLKAERALFESAGVKDPEDNKNYVQSSRDDVTAMFQAGDEGAFLLVGEGSYASYREAQRSSTMLRKVAGTGIYRKGYVCVVKDSGFRKERGLLASRLAAWLRGGEARKTVESFDMAGIAPFRWLAPLGVGKAP